MTVTSCSACLGMRECWICSGDGCPRCAETGACHVCAAPPLDVVQQPQQGLLDSSAAEPTFSAP